MEKSCCFFGHRNVFEDIQDKLNHEVEKLVKQGVIYFYEGGMGEFDSMSAGAIKIAKAINPNVKHYLIKPYFSNELNTSKIYYESCYDDVVIPTELAGIHYKAAIKKRNQWMISQCEYVICYIRRDFGGAYDAVKFAQKQNKTIIRI